LSRKHANKLFKPLGLGRTDFERLLDQRIGQRYYPLSAASLVGGSDHSDGPQQRLRFAGEHPPVEGVLCHWRAKPGWAGGLVDDGEERF